jgi:2-haloacid dehalogenase
MDMYRARWVVPLRDGARPDHSWQGGGTLKRYRNAVLFDVIGTLFQLTPLEKRLGGKPELDAWFERLLHSGAALTLSGQWQPFDELAASTLKTALARTGKDVDAERVLEELQQLPPYPDAGPALTVLEEAGLTVGVLTNGGERSTRKLLEAAGLAERVAEIVSVEEVELYKPHPAVYRHAAERIGAEPSRTTVIAAHAWDVVGAKQAGLGGVWIDRLEHEWPFARGKPRKAASDLEEAARFVVAKL